jgi:arylsulfatase A-like enzyme
MNRNLILLAAGLALPEALFAQKSGDQTKPNVIVILADDMGFSDIGCFGSEIPTPCLDSLASKGLRLTQMYNSARSCPSRASLMTGLYPHASGLGQMTDRTTWTSAYSGFRSDHNVTLAEVMKSAGYFTALAGKWHLGTLTDPIKRGFDEFFGLIPGYAPYYDASQYTRMPADRPMHHYDNFYSTTAITDYAIDFTDEAKAKGQPFFMYLAYNAPHFPLQAPKELIDKYMPIYLQGWDKIRDERYKRVMQLGILPKGTPNTPRGIVPAGQVYTEPHDIPAWDSLPEDEKYDLARRMATYAAVIDLLDQNIHRLIDHLKSEGTLDNTFIIFMSDNGACAEWHEFGFDGKSGKKFILHKGADLDKIGTAESFVEYGTGWANACDTPLWSYKHYTHEGGISTPCVVFYGDNIKKKGEINATPVHITDVMATCVALSGATYPSEYQGRTIYPMEGKSLLPLLSNHRMGKRVIFAEHEGNRLVRQGDWKICASLYNDQPWELYNVKKDRTERHNLASKYPNKVKRMAKLYDAWADKWEILPYTPNVEKIASERLKDEMKVKLETINKK